MTRATVEGTAIAIFAAAGWLDAQPLTVARGAAAERYHGAHRLRVTLALHPDCLWRSHVTHCGALLGSGEDADAAVAMDDAIQAARVRLAGLAGLL